MAARPRAIKMSHPDAALVSPDCDLVVVNPKKITRRSALTGRFRGPGRQGQGLGLVVEHAEHLQPQLPSHDISPRICEDKEIYQSPRKSPSKKSYSRGARDRTLQLQRACSIPCMNARIVAPACSLRVFLSSCTASRQRHRHGACICDMHRAS